MQELAISTFLQNLFYEKNYVYSKKFKTRKSGYSRFLHGSDEIFMHHQCLNCKIPKGAIPIPNFPCYDKGHSKTGTGRQPGGPPVIHEQILPYLYLNHRGGIHFR